MCHHAYWNQPWEMDRLQGVTHRSYTLALKQALVSFRLILPTSDSLILTRALMEVGVTIGWLVLVLVKNGLDQEVLVKNGLDQEVFELQEQATRMLVSDVNAFQASRQRSFIAVVVFTAGLWYYVHLHACFWDIQTLQLETHRPIVAEIFMHEHFRFSSAFEE